MSFRKEGLLLDVIISHLSDESKDILRNKGTIISNQRPLFNYINLKESETTLTSLIKNTSGYLTEIKFDNLVCTNDEMVNRSIIQAIYQNFDVLYIHNDSGLGVEHIDNWDFLFEILAKYSPTSLFKFENTPGWQQLELIFDNWKNRTPIHSMLLQTLLVFISK
ncbi:hypothetical protein C1645_878932 [Glomus cerebriforme]|uniref:Uncharacterized protein n=1 Tax=Glomus cerebriforme TaxID=658196 RepID=A0A397STL7_9GLOM|nr:hypothetical protein C1645_878932 [Glomus cerebriforme]